MVAGPIMCDVTVIQELDNNEAFSLSTRAHALPVASSDLALVVWTAPPSHGWTDQVSTVETQDRQDIYAA